MEAPNNGKAISIAVIQAQLATVLENLKDGREWMHNHELSELAYQRKIEAHMATANAQHKNIISEDVKMEERIIVLERSINSLQTRIGWLTGTLALAVSAGGAAFALLFHAHFGG